MQIEHGGQHVRVGANHVDRPGTGLEALLAYLPTQLITGIYGRIARGGFLTVTPHELIFEPHAVNMARERSMLRIPLAEVTGVRSRQRMISALLRVCTVQGDIDFVCWSRKRVIAAVLAARPDLDATPGA